MGILHLILLALGTKAEVYPIFLCPSETAFQYHSVQPAHCSTLEQLPRHCPDPQPSPTPDLTAVGSVKHFQKKKNKKNNQTKQLCNNPKLERLPECPHCLLYIQKCPLCLIYLVHRCLSCSSQLQTTWLKYVLKGKTSPKPDRDSEQRELRV